MDGATFPVIFTWMLSFSIAIFLFYTIYVCFKFPGKIESYSQTYYLLPKGLQFLFPFYCNLLIYTLLIPWMLLSGESNGWLQFIAILTGVALLFTGATANYSVLQRIEAWHTGVSFLAGILSAVWSVGYYFSHNHSNWGIGFLVIYALLFLASVIVLLFRIKKPKGIIFYLELAAFSLLYINIIIAAKYQDVLIF